MAKKVLLVEDEQLSRKAYGELLRTEGYDVREAGNGVEALEVMAAETCDVVITNFSMPVMDGFRLLELLHIKWPHIPAIVVTGYLSPRAGKTILGQRIADILPKPIDFRALLDTVRQVAPD